MNFEFFPNLVLRTPAFPINKYETGENNLSELFENTYLMDAIAAASADFSKTCEMLKNGEISDDKKLLKIQITLLKYFNRMCHRATPFGAFASCSTLSWDKVSNVEIDSHNTAFHIHPDTLFLCRIIEEFELKFRTSLSYQLNSSVYKVGNEYRYYYYEIKNETKKHHINSVGATKELDFIYNLCQDNFVSYEQIIMLTCNYSDYDIVDVTELVVDLIDAQLLVSVLQPRLGEHDFLSQIITVLAELNFSNPIEELNELISKLKAFKQDFPFTKSKGLLSSFLKKKKREFEKILNREIQGNPFQINSYKPSLKNSLDEKIKNQVLDAIHACQVLTVSTDPWLENIKEQIKHKFGTKPILLAHLFDPDLGITDPASNAIINFNDEILNELNPLASSAISRERETPIKELIKQFFNSKFDSNENSTSLTIHVSPDDLNELAEKIKLAPLPDTFPVMFKLINDATANVAIETAGGYSGTTLLGRFGNENNDILNILKEIAQFEKEKNKFLQIASVTHLPETQAGNVLRNPSLRDFEIPYLSASNLPSRYQLKISELEVQYKNNAIFLYSKKGGKQVFPKIDNAHNFKNNSLPIYRLLSSLQTQFTKANLNVVFKTYFKGTTFYPRIQYKSIILQSAQWVLKEENLKPFRKITAIEQQIALFNTKCIFWGIPKKLLWVESDQTMFLNRDDEYSFSLLFNGMIRKKEITLREFHEPDADYVKDKDGSVYNHQFITIIKNNEQQQATEKQAEIRSITRSFPPGSEWCYIKIYCSVFFSDTLLSDLLYPLLKKWSDNAKIDTWFFVRYKDPDEHIRIRFRLTNLHFLSTLLEELNTCLASYQQQGFIPRIAIDTYERELERYNVPDYLVIEKYFEISSDFCIQVLMNKGIEHEIPLMLLSIKMIDEIYDLFSLTTEKKTNFIIKKQSGVSG